MAFSTDVVGQGTLTGTPTIDIIRTATTNETHRITFTNDSGANVTVEFYINGAVAQNRLGPKATIDASGGACVLTLDLGNGDDIRAKASAASTIVWTDEMVVLT